MLEEEICDLTNDGQQAEQEVWGARQLFSILTSADQRLMPTLKWSLIGFCKRKVI
ncbi:hypothetical protein DPMN_093271 [Dreissena polymorpha]|uniref:Uncharacterized protein n=1 Tax=Dreissena polymorpha TaxID=45954 RepID=A0A9D4R1K9_DREPO|nr:hypothetical protein DPMN_093271 [Dreissena polymorpha]